MDISVVIPVFNEDENIHNLYVDLTSVLDELGVTSEVLFVDDGSTDRSPQILDELAAADPRVRVVHFRRNYGQTAALMAAIRFSGGDVIIPMDCDGQNDPRDIPRLLARLADGYDVVSGWRKKREDTMITRRLPSMAANWLISRTMGVKLHDYGCTLKAYRRSVVEDIRLYGEMHRFLPVYAAWEGARVTELVVNHHPRRFGKSKYGIGRVSRVILDLFTLYFLGQAFDRPIQFFGKFGIALGGISALIFAVSLWLRFFEHISLIQTPLPLLAAASGLTGAMFLMLGVLAEVQARTYYESQGRTHYKVKSTRNIAATAELAKEPALVPPQ